ncbi:syntaxin-17 isoform X1 [Anoplophora glabripennis]|uniref:syntaxin-17 isoform X1 n=1 Tax=Anoplophora glabripennis TaxID=217634 RepID=UPI0008758D10|nr:syntaxin-17 isoform X1 [Anoplophora glabripennis]
MASAFSPGIQKQSLKYIEVPLSKFTDEVIPHHQKVYEQYKTTIQKLVLVNNAEQLKREIKDKKRTVKQLRDLMYELDTLRAQVEDEDLDKFDIKTLSLRKIILNLVNGYTELEKTVDRVTSTINENEEVGKENRNPFEGASQIQIQGNIADLKLKQHKDQLCKVENINNDVKELHEMYKDLNEMVVGQGEHVDNVEQSVENTQENVESGVRDIIKAHKLKAVAYPVTGAFLGGIIGGPIGLVAGLKVGGIAALGCAIAGYTGGKYFKKFHDPDDIVREDVGTAAEQDTSDTFQKKDI